MVAADPLAAAKPPNANAWFAPTFASIVLVVNAVLLGVAWHDRSWTAFGIAVAVVPFASGSPWVYRSRASLWIGW